MSWQRPRGYWMHNKFSSRLTSGKRVICLREQKRKSRVRPRSMKARSVMPRPSSTRKALHIPGGGAWCLRERRIGYSVLRPERGVFDLDESTLGEVVGSSPVLLVCDRRVAAIHLEAWRRYAQRHLNVSGEYLADGSESAKTWDQVHEICSAAATCGLPRNGVVIGIGGGVTLDVAGVAASIFRRGVPYLRIPTSLVGLIDVSVGIKQGVNAHGRKNLLGSFYPPLASINDYRFLGTLPACEISNGIAEIVKIASLRDPICWSCLRIMAQSCSRPASDARRI